MTACFLFGRLCGLRLTKSVLADQAAEKIE